jgi:hypothetical protein
MHRLLGHYDRMISKYLKGQGAVDGVDRQSVCLLDVSPKFVMPVTWKKIQYLRLVCALNVRFMLYNYTVPHAHQKRIYH